MDLKSDDITNFCDLCNSFVEHYKYNIYLAPDHDQCRSMVQKDKESFKEYA